MARLDKILDKRPDVWQEAGDFARFAELTWIKQIAGDNLLAERSLCKKMEQIRQEQAGPSPSPLEKILVDRIVVSMLAAESADIAEAKGFYQSNVKIVELQLKRIESAHRRVLSAIKTLGQVRRLAAGIRIEISHNESVRSKPLHGHDPDLIEPADRPAGSHLRAERLEQLLGRSEPAPSPALAGTEE